MQQQKLHQLETLFRTFFAKAQADFVEQKVFKNHFSL